MDGNEVMFRGVRTTVRCRAELGVRTWLSKDRIPMGAAASLSGLEPEWGDSVCKASLAT